MTSPSIRELWEVGNFFENWCVRAYNKGNSFMYYAIKNIAFYMILYTTNITSKVNILLYSGLRGNEAPEYQDAPNWKKKRPETTF